jgi:hypothetical protein
MGGNENDGSYCTICGGIPPDKIKIKRILVDGKATGIDQLDWIVGEVRKLNLSDDTAITNELLMRTKALNYIPTRMTEKYGEALLEEYKNPK